MKIVKIDDRIYKIEIIQQDLEHRRNWLRIKLNGKGDMQHMQKLLNMTHSNSMLVATKYKKMLYVLNGDSIGLIQGAYCSDVVTEDSVRFVFDYYYIFKDDEMETSDIFTEEDLIYAKSLGTISKFNL